MLNLYIDSFYLHLNFNSRKYWKFMDQSGQTGTTKYFHSVQQQNLRTFAGYHIIDSPIFMASNDENFQFSSVNKEYI